MMNIKNSFIFLFLLSCTHAPKGTFNSRELTSTQGEKIYVNTLNWGMTDDYQLSIISHNKERLKNRVDTIDAIKGLEPFVYYFKNDSLKLFFEDKITYRVNEELRTISVEYIILNSEDYMKIRTRSFENDNYFYVPVRKENVFPSDYPKAPSK